LTAGLRERIDQLYPHASEAGIVCPEEAHRPCANNGQVVDVFRQEVVSACTAALMRAAVRVLSVILAPEVPANQTPPASLRIPEADHTADRALTASGSAASSFRSRAKPRLMWVPTVLTGSSRIWDISR